MLLKNPLTLWASEVKTAYNKHYTIQVLCSTEVFLLGYNNVEQSIANSIEPVHDFL